jgi:secondary thiamine-phosphate synthase enzyme
MAVYRKTLRFSTHGRTDVLDITGDVNRAVAESRIACGIVNVAGVGSTRGITTLEYEPGCVSDLRRALEQVAPANSQYPHNARWGDDNGYAHLRSALVGTARSFPVSDGKAHLGAWQQIVLCDFDDRLRNRGRLTTSLNGHEEQLAPLRNP